MRRLLIALVLLLSGSAVMAQVTRVDTPILSKYDLDSATYVYCKLGFSLIGPGRIETSGSSATVTAVSGSTDPYTNVAVGDELFISGAAGNFTRTVTARASATSITVDSAVNLDVDGGYIFNYRTLSCGAAVTDGWIQVGPGKHTITIIYRQGDLGGGVDYSLESRARGALGLPLQETYGTIAATTTLVNGVSIVLGETTPEFRVGLKYNTSDTSDATTNLEQIDIILSTER
jgi:hypothetical protein